ncbi:embryogenic cell protein 40-like [Penaeus japonicus]|uniref:embryogenic cell protein 40-like n=1 Tax=Penaeus japonicus TaxID=27405 RepID=UPI001C70C323|nr:embryogenic cell protein 40-like [Penaeus japonicus]
MARNVAVTSLIVALCLVAAVTGHRSYGLGGRGPFGGVHGGIHATGGFQGSVHRPVGVHGSVHRPIGVHGSVHRPIGVHGSVHRPIGNVGVHGGSVHGLGGVGSGIHGAGSLNAAHYPNLVPGYSFYDTRPVLGLNKCKFWCRSAITSKYYCCQRPLYG